MALALPRKLAMEIPAFEVAQALDSAQVELAGFLPPELVPEIIESMTADRGVVPGTYTTVMLPRWFVEPYFIEFATERDENNVPLRVDARVVPPGEYDLLQHLGTSEKIASLRNGRLLLWPEPIGPVSGASAAVRMTYKRRPNPYLRGTISRTNSLIISLKQSLDNARLFKPVNDIGFITLGMLYDVNDEDYTDGIIYLGRRSTDEGPFTMYRLTMGDVAVVMSHCFINVIANELVPAAYDDGDGYCRYDNCIIVPPVSYSGGPIMADDGESPELDEYWHAVLVDIAAGRLLINHDLGRTGISHLRLAEASLEARGVKVQLTREQYRDEGGKYQ